MPVKQVPDGATSDTEECAAGNTVEETTDDHGFDVLGHRTRDHPDQKEGERKDINISPAIKLTTVSIRRAVLECDNVPRTMGLGREVQRLYSSISIDTTLQTSQRNVPSPQIKKDNPSVTTMCDEPNSGMI